MLQNAYSVAKIGADTAENERNFAEICQKLATTLRVHYPTERALQRPLRAAPGEARPERDAAGGGAVPASLQDLQNWEN